MSWPRIGSVTPNGTPFRNWSHRIHSLLPARPIISETTSEPMPTILRICSRRIIAGCTVPAPPVPMTMYGLAMEETAIHRFPYSITNANPRIKVKSEACARRLVT